MTAIITSDLHFNERPRDQYRWGLIPWLCENHKADELIIGGDLTDAKDRHSAQLVNRLYNAILDASVKYRVIILKGNHDYIDKNHPFFEFLGNNSDVIFVAEPTELILSIGRALFVPAGVNWSELTWNIHCDFLFAHATFSGAKAENGSTMTGVDPAMVKGFSGKVFSGDIHVPQVLNRTIEYIGAPYHTRFGDCFDPRIIRITGSGKLIKQEDLHFPAPRKWTYIIGKPDHLLDEKAKKGDHVKVKCQLRRADYVYWKEYRAEIQAIAERRGWELYGVEPVALEITPKEKDEVQNVMMPGELIEAYVKKHKASKDHLRIGKELLNG